MKGVKLQPSSPDKSIFKKSSLIRVTEEMETSFRHFNTFKDFINVKLEASKHENVYKKMFALEKESERLKT